MIRTDTNIAFIKNNKGLRLTPDYDNSSMAGLNKNIENNIESIKQGYDIYKYTDQLKNSLKLTDKDTGFFLKDFAIFAKKYPYQCESIINSLNKINVQEAIQKVEKINNVTVPWAVNYWIEKTIENRKTDLQNIYIKSKTKGR